MALYRKIDESLGLVMVTAMETVTSTEIMELVLSLDETPGSENTYRRLIDLRNAEFHVTPMEIDDVSKHAQHQKSLESTQRIALLTPPKQDPFITSFMDHMIAGGVEMKEFNDMAPALDWLNGR